MRGMEGVGGVVKDVCIHSGGEGFQGCGISTVKCDMQEYINCSTLRFIS